MKTIRDILMTYEPRPSAEVDQALKEIEEVIQEEVNKARIEWYKQQQELSLMSEEEKTKKMLEIWDKLK